MSLNKKELVDKNLYELEFTVDKSTFDSAVDAVYRRQVKKINIPGFRKGKAPKSIIEKMYGKGVFYEDAVNDIIPAAFTEALKESELTPVSRPEFDVDKIDDEGVVLKAKFYVKPEVEIKNYLGIEAAKTIKSVSDEDVDAEIERVRARNSRLIEINDRPAQNGDSVTIDFDGYVDGEQFEGGKAEGHILKLGSGQFIPGFEDQVVGHNIGDSFDVNVTFPTEYHAENLAGKDAVFKVTLHAIKFDELPALDDEFAKDVSEFDTLDEYKADVKAKLQEKNNKSADAEVEEKIIDTLIENLEADIPEAMFENETENFVRDYDSRLRMQGLDLSTYFKYTGLDLDALRKQFRPQAERQVKTRLALEKIVALEGITASEQEVEDEYNRLSQAYGVELDQVKKSVEYSALEADLCVKKAVDLIKEKAVITETEAPVAEEKAADAEKAE